MNKLSDIGTIKDILHRHGFTFSKALGQNFLINPSVCPRMAELSGAGEGVGVIEVGPGIGVLTNELCKLADKVADVLELDLNKLIADEFPGMEVVICANLPYYITSPVIMKLLEDRLPVTAITVMVQKEAAQRICAPVGSRESGAVTVSVNYYAEPSLQFHVSAGSFMPAPKVDSAVIRLDIREDPPVEVDEKTFFKVVKAAFSQRRKVISNSLSSGLKLSKDEINGILERAGVPANARAEKLSLEDFAKIANEVIK